MVVGRGRPRAGHGAPWRSMPIGIHAKSMAAPWTVHGSPWRFYGGPWRVHGGRLRVHGGLRRVHGGPWRVHGESMVCLLYTSDAADDMQCVDLGGRRII